MDKKKKNQGFLSKQLFKQFISFIDKYVPDAYKEFLSESDLIEFYQNRFNFLFFVHKKVAHNGFARNIKVEVSVKSQEFWLANSLVIEIVSPDVKFLKDSILEYIHSKNLKIVNYIDCVAAVKREGANLVNIQNVHQSKNLMPDYDAEFYMFLQIDANHSIDQISLRKGIERLITDILLVTHDFLNMNSVLSEHETDERKKGLLKWLLDGNFILLGVKASENKFGLFHEAEFEQQVKSEIESEKKEKFIKSNFISYINRKGYVFIINFNDIIITGKFTRKADNSSTEIIPYLLERLNKVIERNKDWTNLDLQDFIYVFNLLPVDYRFVIEPQDFIYFSEIANRARIQGEGRGSIQMLSGNKSYLMIVWPISSFNEDLMQRLYSFFHGNEITLYDEISRVLSNLIFKFYNLKIEKKETLIKMKQKSFLQLFEIELNKKLMDWDKAIYENARSRLKKDDFAYVAEKILPAFPQYYKTKVSSDQAFQDLKYLNELVITKNKTRIVTTPVADTDLIRLSIISSEVFSLSYLVPILTNFGLNVLEEDIFEMIVCGDKYFLYKFQIEIINNKEIKIQNFTERLNVALIRIIDKRASSEPLNILISRSNLTLSQVELLKALIAYFVQSFKNYSRLYVKDLFINNPEMGSAIVYLFETRFLKNLENKGLDIYELIKKEIFEKSDFNKDQFFIERNKKIDSFNPSNLIQQQIYNSICEIVNATVRTNYFLYKDVISIKIKSESINYLTEPKPYFETWVYHPNMEAVHLRGGKHARGGIRWSDRADDFRTEVWGLWKTQVLKNSVIIPTGAKGGFVIKYLKNNLENGIWAYRLFMTSLLEITGDGSKVNSLIPVLDENDPYLVVAADKGTAAFSDYANEISLDMDFWLKDAFASGGKDGYSHKALGITAKGAWESVKWHFYVKNININTVPFTVIGIGDMSGDVFGNAMILSNKIKLVGAFNHKYIFVDPYPEPEESYQERLKLFNTQGQWDKYDRSKISQGGGVYFRDSVSIKISSQMKSLFKIESDFLNGDQLIKVLLTFSCDLLFNGGIGTYIKSSTELNSKVDDISNDSVRVDASELKAVVVAEGGNLGITPAARIEYDSLGGIINTDAVDNSAGVNLSDHEVNIKILLNSLLETKKIKTIQARNSLLNSISNSVVASVLSDNFLQNYLINYLFSLPVYEKKNILDMIGVLVRENIFEEGKVIPDREILYARLEKNEIIHRPVMAILLAYTKIYLQKKTSAISSSFSENFLLNYFPESLQKFRNEIISHSLNREITSTLMINFVVNNGGINYIYKALTYLNLTTEQTILYYIQGREVLKYDQLVICKYLPVISTQTFPSGFLFHEVFEIKYLMERALYSYIEMLTIFPVKGGQNIQKYSSLLPINPNDKMSIKFNLDPLRLDEESRQEALQLSYIELRFVIHHLLNNKQKEKQKEFVTYYYQSGFADLKRILYSVTPENFWEIQSLHSAKKLFWLGTVHLFQLNESKNCKNINILSEVEKIKTGRISISTLRGFIDYLFKDYSINLHQ